MSWPSPSVVALLVAFGSERFSDMLTASYISAMVSVTQVPLYIQNGLHLDVDLLLSWTLCRTFHTDWLNTLAHWFKVKTPRLCMRSIKSRKITCEQFKLKCIFCPSGYKFSSPDCICFNTKQSTTAGTWKCSSLFDAIWDCACFKSGLFGLHKPFFASCSHCYTCSVVI